MVAGPGVEPGTKAYETFMIPFQYPAIGNLVPLDGIEPTIDAYKATVIPFN